MESSRTHRVRFLLPDNSSEPSDGSWLDGDEMRNRFELKLSKLVVPPPPKMSPQLVDPDELLIELKRKLMAIDRTIQFKDVVLEEEEEFENSHPIIQAPEIQSENKNEDFDSQAKRQPTFKARNPPVQEQLVMEKQSNRETTEKSDEPTRQLFDEKLPKQPQGKQLKDIQPPNSTPRICPKRPPLPPNKRIQTSREADVQANVKRQDSVPRSFKTRRRSFRDFSKRQFHRALSAMNISRSGDQEQKLLRSNSIDAKIDSSSTDSTSGLQHEGEMIRSKSSSSNSLLVSNIRSRFQRFPSNNYKKSKRGNVSEQRDMEPLKRRSSWTKLFSSWSSNLQSCTRVQTDD